MIIYRRFRLDIWGLCLLSCNYWDMIRYKRITSFFYDLHLLKQKARRAAKKRFIYRTDVIEPIKRRVYLKKRFVTLRVVRFFYLTLTYKQFWKMAVESKRKEGLFERHYCLALEGRLVSFLYRSSFVPNLFDCIQLVKQSNIVVNRKNRNFVNQPVNLFQLLSFHPMIKAHIYLDLFKRIFLGRKRVLFLFNHPRYMFVSYWFIFAYMKIHPRRRQLIFRTTIDIYRATGFAD